MAIILEDKEEYFALFREQNITSYDQWNNIFPLLDLSTDPRPWTLFGMSMEEFLEECYPYEENVFTLTPKENAAVSSVVLKAANKLSTVMSKYNIPNYIESNLVGKNGVKYNLKFTKVDDE